MCPSSCPRQNLRWRDSSRFVWTEGLQTLFVFQRLGKGSRRLGQQEQRGRLGAPGGRVGTPGPSGRDPKRPPLTSFPLCPAAAVLYCYFYKRTAVHLGDPLFYQDSLWLRKEFAHFRG